MTGERRDAEHLSDPLSVDVVQGRCDALREMSEPWLPDAAAELAPPAVADRGARLAALERLQREGIRLKVETERLKERHYRYQCTLAGDDVEGWMILAEVADDLADLEAEPFAGLSFLGRTPSPEALHAAADACERSRMGLRALSRRLDDLERLLADRHRSIADMAPRLQRCQRSAESERRDAQRRQEHDKRTRANPSTVGRWPSDDRTGPASLVARQPVLSNAPPSGDGPAQHLAAI